MMNYQAVTHLENIGQDANQGNSYAYQYWKHGKTFESVWNTRITLRTPLGGLNSLTSPLLRKKHYGATKTTTCTGKRLCVSGSILYANGVAPIKAPGKKLPSQIIDDTIPTGDSIPFSPYFA